MTPITVSCKSCVFIQFRLNTQVSGFWNKHQNVQDFIFSLKEKLNLQTPDDWNKITQNQIKLLGGSTLLTRYSMYEIKKLGCPEGEKLYNKPSKPSGYWDKEENIQNFIEDLRKNLNLKTIDDWNNITTKQIKLFGGSFLLNKYSLFDIKCLGFPEGKELFKLPLKPPKYWDNKENIQNFISYLKEKLSLKTIDDWNKITFQQIRSMGGSGLLIKITLYELKCMGCPEGKFIFEDTSNKPSGYWCDDKNIKKFIEKLRINYKLKTIDDWNTLTQKQIKSFGGSSLLTKYSLSEIKAMGCPEGKFLFENINKPSGYWDKEENIQRFIKDLRKNLNLKTVDDWNCVTQKQIKSLGGNTLLAKYSLTKIKVMGCPEGKLIFEETNKPPGYWDDNDNIQKFIDTIRNNFNLKSVDDWNSLTTKQIVNFGGYSLLNKFSLFEIKCLGFPNGENVFMKPKKSAGYWDKEENILKFLKQIKEKLNLKTIEDWNTLSTNDIISFGGSMLFNNYSLYDIKCLGYPDGKLQFDEPNKHPGFWDNNENIQLFLNKLKQKYNICSPDDWKRISKTQVYSSGGGGFISKCILNQENRNELEKKFPEIQYLSQKSKLVGRSSQRWLFLQVQKLFPNEEIVEDYFHSEISRENGFSVQFDIFLINRNIAIEYHGKQHYEDIPTGFGPLEMYKTRDVEKQKICKRFGIDLIIIPYWWDNDIESLRETIFSKFNQ